jgi:class 3 adenylate cyclase/tetratricopeptide (TPR) repeat protein/ribosomal protein L40E
MGRSQCGRCDGENPTEARFCMHCAAPLGGVCRRCGAELPGEARFCPRCAHPVDVGAPEVHSETSREPRSYTPKHLADKILTSRAALEGERKQVTVLFADVKGSMELTERMDPEEWSKIMSRFFQILSHGVERFEGFVDKFTGDGIMALFGAPIAHEDHAQRACYAALHLRDEIRRYADALRLAQGIDFSVRLGINSGDVVVGRIGDDLRMDYTAQGHTVGMAQRMEQLAAAHTVCLSEATAKLVSGYVELRDLGTAAVKGASGPIRVFELVGVGKHRTRLDMARSRGLTRFVGRDSDLQTLEAALEQARAGEGHVIGVVAEAGTGKSRLCFEFVERCRRRGISVNEGHCPAHGKTVPYLPVLEMLRDIFAIDDRDGDHEARRKIAGELLLLDASFQELLPLVFDFLGVPDPERPAPSMSPEARQRQLIAFVRHLTQARSQRELRVLLIDDAHWIDAGSDAFLAQAVEAASGTRTLLLVNFRPEYHADWMSKSYYRQLPLRPLGRDATEELLADLLGRDASLAGLPERIHERTRGNPFFIEELTQSLVESRRLEGARGAYRLVASVEQLELPATVQAVLAARIDRLAEREKRLLQTASVIGKELPEPLLRRVAELPDAELPAALAALVQGEFLIEKALYPEAEYAFKHPLTHEVAYQSQLGERRARTHASVARALEELYADRIDELAALLAQHWDTAGEALVAARWHARAARRAGLANPREALRHCSRVRELLAGAEPSEEAAALRLEATNQLLALEWRMGGDFARGRALLSEGLELAARTGDLHSRALLLLNFAGMYGTSLGELFGGWAELEEAFELAMRSDDPELRFTVHEEKIDRLQFTGRLSEAAALGDRYVELGRALAPGSIVRGFIPVAWAPGRRAWIWMEMGRLEAAEAGLRESADGMRMTVDTEFLSYVEALLAKRAALAGDVDAACLHARRAFDIAEKVGSTIARVWAEEYLGVALGCSGDWNAAVEHLEAALRTARDTRSWLTIEAEILAYLAEARLGAGDTEAAQRTAEEAIETGRKRKTPVWEAQAHLALARVLLARFGADARDEIDSALSCCLSLIEQTAARVWEPHVYQLRAELARLLGDETTRERELREAHRLFTAIGATGHAERVAKELEGQP